MRTRVVSLVAALGLALGLLTVLPALPASAASSPNLKGLANSLNKAKHLTYYAQYTTVSGGNKETITIAQAPPKSLFSSANGGSVIDTGKTTYYCGNSGSSGNSGNSGNSGSSGSSGNSGNSGGATTTTAQATVNCVKQSGSNSALSGAESLFSPTVLASLLNEASNSSIARALGVKVSSSSATFAGQPSTCLTFTARIKGGKYCVTKQGLLSYSGTSKTNYFQLTKYSSKPPASLFTLPAGATTQTLPGVG